MRPIGHLLFDLAQTIGNIGHGNRRSRNAGRLHIRHGAGHLGQLLRRLIQSLLQRIDTRGQTVDLRLISSGIGRVQSRGRLACVKALLIGRGDRRNRRLAEVVGCAAVLAASAGFLSDGAGGVTTSGTGIGAGTAATGAGGCGRKRNRRRHSIWRRHRSWRLVGGAEAGCRQRRNGRQRFGNCSARNSAFDRSNGIARIRRFCRSALKPNRNCCRSCRTFQGKQAYRLLAASCRPTCDCRCRRSTGKRLPYCT